ncbi:LOB domain-containing protein 15 [Orobanche gracilis]
MSREREEFEEIEKKLIDGCNNNNNRVNMGRRHMLGPPSPASAGSLNTITPCAACKLLRRRCADECPFSPYFSPHEPHKFAAVHKVFGASSVSKMLMEVPEFQRSDAANSLVYEANVRLRDPVYGCMGAISALQQHVQTLQAELNSFRAEILRYKYREAASTIVTSTHVALAVSVSELQQDPPIPTTSPPAPVSDVPPPPPRTTSVALSSASVDSGAPSLYTPSSSTTSYTSISNNHLPYFC